MARKPKAMPKKGAKSVVGLSKSGSPDKIIDRVGGGKVTDRGIQKKGAGWRNE
jgi:hypothetical protein